MTNPLTLSQIQYYIPHREPMLLLENVQDWHPHTHLTATYTPQVNNPIFAGHFPNNPLWPGVLQVEGMAQAGALLVGLSQNVPAAQATYLFSKIEGVQFMAPVKPNQTLTYHVTQTKAKLGFFTFTATTHVGLTQVAAATFTAKFIKS